MTTIFRYALERLRGQVLGWGLTLFLLGLAAAARFDLVYESKEEFLKILKGPIGGVVKMFGDPDKMFTSEGFLTMQFFSWLPLLLGVFAVLAGSGLLVADEENGTLDLVLAHPVSRTALFVGRFLAFVAATVGILFIAWLGLVVAASRSAKLDLNVGPLLWPFLSLLAVLLLYGSLALLLSLLLPSRRMAASAAGLLLVVSFFLSGLARADPSLKPLARCLPLEYYQSGEAVHGLNGAWFGGLLGVTLLFAGLAWSLFERRDIRVGGEAGWRLPWRRRKATV
jgi:ABC-2 type transport system permease protein